LTNRISNAELLKTIMPATIVVGGQYGPKQRQSRRSIGQPSKRAVARPLRWTDSGHTVRIDGEDLVLRQVPCCVEPHKATFCVAAGCVIDEEVFPWRAHMLNVDRDQIIVDPRAVIVTEGDRDVERRELRDIRQHVLRNRRSVGTANVSASRGASRQGFFSTPNPLSYRTVRHCSTMLSIAVPTSLSKALRVLRCRSYTAQIIPL